jgi:glucosamine 6-phosphate synthetase-like amidotransferase/phosphosugar isomerase protein
MKSGSAPRCWKAPRHIAEFLKQEAQVKLLGEEIAKATDVLYMGRGPSAFRWRWKAR